MRMRMYLTETVQEIERNINIAILQKINGVMLRSLGLIETQVQIILRNVLESSPVYIDIASGGPLAAELGIPKGEEKNRLDQIVDQLISEIEIEYRPMSYIAGLYTGGLTIFMFEKQFKNILGLSAAVINTQKGQSLPWLDWLIIQGDKIIISEHKFAPAKVKSSRSGGGIMVEGQGNFWRVPPQYSGTETNNWIIRAISDNIDAIENEVGSTIQKLF